jgi:Xaa-Pro dipeptidase
MRLMGVPALLTSDPINIVYASGVRNMTVFGLMGPSRFLLLFADGPSILFEFAGCSHLAADLPTVTEIRDAPGITPLAGPAYQSAIHSFAGEITNDMRTYGSEHRLAVERVDFLITDALRENKMELADATAVFTEARRIKLPEEVEAIRSAIVGVEAAVQEMEMQLKPGVSEVSAWSQFHRGLIAADGEYVSTRLFQSGSHTFPYFQEAGPRVIQKGELVCFDTDAIGSHSYAVDFSRTFVCGVDRATPEQRSLHAAALDQLQHNAALLGPKRTYESIAREAWPIPARFRPYGYYCILHGLGLSGEYPYVPLLNGEAPYDFPGELEVGMVVCVESYIGCDQSSQGVKLEDQFLITATGAERLTTYPFSAALI